jgi:hypothetical protein
VRAGRARTGHRRSRWIGFRAYLVFRIAHLYFPQGKIIHANPSRLLISFRKLVTGYERAQLVPALRRKPYLSEA